MSSSAIMAQIHSCENQISVTKLEIIKLQDKVEKQENAISVFGLRYTDFMSEIDEKSSKISAVVSYDPEDVAAVRFGEATSYEFESKKGSVINDVDSIEQGMKTELQQTITELETAEALLQNLNSRLSSLWGEYHAAVAREQAEAEAAAAAAAAARVG